MVWPNTAELAAKRLRQIDSLSTASEPVVGLSSPAPKGPADQRTYVQGGEEARGDGRAPHLLRNASLPTDVHQQTAEEGGIFKRVIVLLPHQIVAHAHRAERKVSREVAHVDHRHAIGVGIRQGPQQDAVGDAEHRSIGADAQREREHGYEGECGVLP